MSYLLPLLAGCALLWAAEPEKPAPLRYLRGAGGKFVSESEVTTISTNTGTTYVSVTDRGVEKMTLTLHYDKKHRLTDAEAVLSSPEGRKTATLTLQGKMATLKRGSTADFLKVAEEPIVTTAPDWSDIFQLVLRYDGKKGGLQEFAGLWIHPALPAQTPTFTIERAGSDAITAKEKKVMLERYVVRLRSGVYRVWADAPGRVYKIVQPGPRGITVVLEGHEETTRELR